MQLALCTGRVPGDELALPAGRKALTPQVALTTLISQYALHQIFACVVPQNADTRHGSDH